MFSVRLRHARKAAGLSLSDLGALATISHAAIEEYEQRGGEAIFRCLDTTVRPTECACGIFLRRNL